MEINKELPLCPVATTVGLIGNKWKLLILRELLTGTKRFGELRSRITGISQKVLTQNLRSMEDDGIIERKVYAEVPPRVEYFLSELGDSLRPIIDVMADWGLGYQALVNNGSNEKKVNDL
jgi:DNA-binding HxlR family transcriptional regulator